MWKAGGGCLLLFPRRRGFVTTSIMSWRSPAIAAATRLVNPTQGPRAVGSVKTSYQTLWRLFCCKSLFLLVATWRQRRTMWIQSWRRVTSPLMESLTLNSRRHWACVTAVWTSVKSFESEWVCAGCWRGGVGKKQRLFVFISPCHFSTDEDLVFTSNRLLYLLKNILFKKKKSIY